MAVSYKEKAKRLMYKVDTQMKEIAKLREQLDGYEELLMANNAIVSAVLYAVSADKDNPIEVDRAVVTDAVQGKHVGISKLKDDDSGYVLWYEECQPEEDE